MHIIGTPCTVAQFADHIASLQLDAWRPSLVCIHHCAAPSLAQRPVGFLPQHMLNLQAFYESKGWSAGPHLFTDEDQAWLFSPLDRRGVHAVSFNSSAWGIEMLGDYDIEDPWAGRGLNVLTLTAKITALLLRKIGGDVHDIRFHRDDPKTTKSCPGRRIDKSRFVALVAAAM